MLYTAGVFIGPQGSDSQYEDLFLITDSENVAQSSGTNITGMVDKCPQGLAWLSEPQCPYGQDWQSDSSEDVESCEQSFSALEESDLHVDLVDTDVVNPEMHISKASQQYVQQLSHQSCHGI